MVKIESRTARLCTMSLTMEFSNIVDFFLLFKISAVLYLHSCESKWSCILKSNLSMFGPG